MQINLLAIFLCVLSLTASTQAFTLYAWTYYRSWPTGIQVYNRLELEQGTGDAIINKTADYPGFESYITKQHTLHSSDNKYQGYLVPAVPGSRKMEGHYQLRYTRKIPRVSGLRYSNFTTVVTHCAGNCVTVVLDYGLPIPSGPETHYGSWYITKDGLSKKARDAGQWKVRWRSRTSAPVPAGAWDVYVSV